MGVQRLIKLFLISILGLGLGFAGEAPERDYDLGVYLQGGSQESSDEDTSETALKGELAFAKNFDSGLFLQASAMLDSTDALTQKGESLGAGYQMNDQFGVYGFVDFLQYDLDGYDQTSHYQLRPGIRYGINDQLQLFVHAGIPVTDDRFVEGVTVSDHYTETASGVYRIRSGYEIYNRALSFVKTELETLIGDKMVLSFKGTLAEEDVYALAVEDRFYVTPQWSANVEAGFADNQDFSMVSEDLAGENWHVFVGMAWNPFSADLKSARKGMIYPRAYPMIVQEVKQTASTTQVSSETLSLNVIATPDSGTTPCEVSFIIRAQGGQAPYTYTVNYGDGGSFTTQSQSAGESVKVVKTSSALLNYAHTYSSQGSYSWSVNVVDALGYSANQQGTIRVSPPVISNYIIQATAGEGGSISPSGNVSVNPGANITFTMTPNNGMQIQSITIDGQSLAGFLKSKGQGVNPAGQTETYTFTNVRGNHTIHVEFDEFWND